MKKKIFLYLFFLIMSSTIVFGIVTAVNTQKLFHSIIQNTKGDVFSQIQERIRTYDKILYFIEKSMVEYGEKAVMQIADELKSPELRDTMSMDDLRRMADEYNVNEIYIIQNNGVVTNTSFPPDLNFNLYTISPDFETFLRGVFGKGKVFSSKLTTSENTGIINNYLYYSPKGSDYIVEISNKVRDFLHSNFSEDFYRNLIGEYFSVVVMENQYLKFLEIYQITEKAKWSLINEGKTFPRDSVLTARLMETGEIELVDDYNYKIVRLFDFDSENFDWFHRHFIEVEFDFSVLAVYMHKMILSLSISALAVVLLFFTLSTQVFNRQFVKRVQSIDNAIKEIEAENYDVKIDMPGSDELNHIARHVESMANAVKKKIDKLEGFIPICASCKDVRDDEGFWHQVESYITDHSDAVFTHAMCPKCLKEYYPDYAEDSLKKKVKGREEEEEI